MKRALFLLLWEDQPDKSSERTGEMLHIPRARARVSYWSHNDDFRECANFLNGRHPGVDWQTLPKYREAIKSLGLGDLLDQDVQIAGQPPHAKKFARAVTGASGWAR